MTLTTLLAQGGGPPIHLEPGGAVVMTVSILIVVALAAFCLYRILKEPTPSTHHHAPLEIDTGDKDA